MMQKKKICLLATGGTIASVPGEDGLRPGIGGGQLLEMVPGLADIAECDCREILQLDSGNIVPAHWVDMARAVARCREEYDGFVISHGTDTMAYSAAALSVMLENIDRPVVLTGAQLPIHAPGSDAVQNLLLAFTAAADGHPGVFVAFSGLLIDGARAKKLCAEQLCAFRSINRPELARYHGGKLHWFRVPAPSDRPFALHDALDERVCVLKLTPGLSPSVLRLLVDHGCHAVILEGYGVGGVPTDESPQSFLPALDYAAESGALIIGTTQCVYDGACLERYENGVLALRHGVISGGTHTTEYLLARTMQLLGEKCGRADFIKALSA